MSTSIEGAVQDAGEGGGALEPIVWEFVRSTRVVFDLQMALERDGSVASGAPHAIDRSLSLAGTAVLSVIGVGRIRHGALSAWQQLHLEWPETYRRSRRQMVQRMGRIVRKKPDGRCARLAILFVEGTMEDPDDGAHEDFTRLVLPVARMVARFGAGSSGAVIAAFLAGG